MARLQLRRGLYTNLPTSGMLAGEPHVTTDRGTLHVATDATTKLPVVPAIDALSTLAAIDGAADLLIMHDSSATGQKEKKITFDAFKTALNIPAGSSDEKVAVVAGGTSGYIWGTDGTDGVIRMNSSMSWTKDAGNAYVTLAVGTVDAGQFCQRIIMSKYIGEKTTTPSSMLVNLAAVQCRRESEQKASICPP